MPGVAPARAVQGCSPEEWRRWQRLTQRLRRLRQSLPARSRQDGESAVALQIGLALRMLRLGRRELRSLALVEVWHQMLRALSETRPWSLPEALEGLGEIARALLPWLCMRCLSHWVDVSHSRKQLLMDCRNVLASDWATVPDPATGSPLPVLCGCGPLVMLLCPFDPVLFRYEWIRVHLHRLATAMERPKPPLVPEREPWLVHLTAFHSFPCKRSLLFAQHSPTPVRSRLRSPERPRLDEMAGPALLQQAGRPPTACGAEPSPCLLRVRGHPQTSRRDAVTAPAVVVTGVTGVREVEMIILEYMQPRALRSAEGVCRAWALIIAQSKRLQQLLQLGALLRDRYVRFFTEAWGESAVRLEVLSLRLILSDSSRAVPLWRDVEGASKASAPGGMASRSAPAPAAPGAGVGSWGV
eukprot:TRINITY_DN27698_c0_g1_i1.p1 TRINITY_DN27698_c0_g1~~TRINITY_DN27698_c0_g1_i1.p1  ORF type:complete len:413 (+),score=70.12 TRINITY_DN27698_c0_g1_i1:85-1323(+)